MSTFMYEGGAGMWAMLVVALVSCGVSIHRRNHGGGRFGLYGALALTAMGVLGFSTGLYNTVAAAGRVAASQSTEILMIGIRESANNTVLGSGLALGLLILAAVLSGRHRAQQEKAAAS